ncbi:MAG: TolC family protein [Nitrospirae bacterium]|nr:TolC family protein [Nitrospirota bacterium]
MKKLLVIMCLILLPDAALADADAVPYALSEAVDFALKNNPRLAASGKDVEIETYGIDRAKAERLPRVDFSSGITRYRYPAPVTPISGNPLAGAAFPEFDNTIYDMGVSFFLPLYRGGRLDRGVAIAEIKKRIAEDTFQVSRQELIYNVTSVFYKIGQLDRLLEANEASVKQLEAHRKNVELFLQAGTVPKVELLKTETELAHARQNALLTRNNLESAYEVLKTLMGIEDQTRKISVVGEEPLVFRYSPEESTARALSQRPDYQAVLKNQRLAEEQIRLVQGKRLPHVYLSGGYSESSGESVTLKENWNLALRLSLPIFDGGSIKAEVNRARKEAEKVKEEERTLRLEILREIRDAYLNIENAGERIDVSGKAIETAKENLRIELLKYETGAGTSADVIDAQTALLRAEADFYQANFDKHIAVASLRRAIGEDIYKEEVSQ